MVLYYTLQVENCLPQCHLVLAVLLQVVVQLPLVMLQQLVSGKVLVNIFHFKLITKTGWHQGCGWSLIFCFNIISPRRYIGLVVLIIVPELGNKYENIMYNNISCNNFFWGVQSLCVMFQTTHYLTNDTAYQAPNWKHNNLSVFMPLEENGDIFWWIFSHMSLQYWLYDFSIRITK